MQKNDVQFTWYDDGPNMIGQNINGMCINHLSKLKKNGVVIISIYPTEQEQIKLEGFLKDYNYEIGKNAWYF